MQILPSTFHLQTFRSIINTHLLPPKNLKFQPFNRSFRNKSSPSIRCCSRKDLGDREEVSQKIHNKKRNRAETEPELLVGDEIPNISFRLPALLILSGKEHIYGMICHFVTLLKKHLEFVVRPAADGGADFGLRWQIEWKDKDLHLGHGCTLDSSHVYNGRIFLRNGKSLIDPLLKWKPANLSMVILFMKMFDKSAKQIFPWDKTMLLGLSYLLCWLIFMAVIFMLNNPFT
ncbi:uncharacterized protein LOC110035724 isoform X2 [Phalaenopsis equestris]|uniref:uncharacterized protein LOC110035724 isoform X2 n=1 Tax=Phalaenopsis equestris TaxID=78828 RepID=UPI0009E1C3CB|nr:uncharacterized protein LOC110035724 isoform X2 [Phalaenopsis equestris]